MNVRIKQKKNNRQTGVGKWPRACCGKKRLREAAFFWREYGKEKDGIFLSELWI